MENWSEESKALLKATGRTEAPLRVFDLNILGLKVITCPDPRPDAWRKHDSKIRVTEWLVEEDNQVAIALTMADCNFDLLQLRDIFGPVLVTRHPFDRDLKLKHLSGFIDSYFGSMSLQDLLASQKAEVMSRSMSQPVPKHVRDTIQQQRDGSISATDLLSYAGPKYNLPVACASCNVHPEKRKTCSRCKSAIYCSKECQVAHWKEHRLHCHPTEVLPGNPIG